MVVPTLHPISIWKATSRDEAFAEEMLVVDDHYGNTFAIGATAEGLMLEVIKMMRPSYKDLPIEVYQFSSKFRDDKRPRGGLVRIREFMMKDAYSFCSSEKQSFKVYQKYYDSYLKIAKELGIKVIPVLADSGAIGGSLSHEFMADSSMGDQTYFVCDHCGYAANIEKAEFLREEKNLNEKAKPFKTVDQPEWVYTMEDNVKHYKEPLWRYLKNVVYKDSKGKLFIASVRGDQEVNEAKLRKVLKVSSLEPADENDLKKLGTKHGYVHSWGEKAEYIGDLGLKMVRNFIGGQKTDKTDSIDVNYGRDFKYPLADIVDAREKNICAKCKKGKFNSNKGLEWGHVFKIDKFYTKAQKGTFADKDGKDKLMWMASYGIGLERCMAIIIEENHDENGIIWPESVAPFKYHLLGLDLHEPKVKAQAEKVYKFLMDNGEEVLYDDRQEISPGEKFKDADLLGMPYRLVVSRKTGEKIEIKKRDKKEQKLVSLSNLLKK